MSVIEKILAKQLAMDVFANVKPNVAGIAQLAIDKGFDNLSDLQKRVLLPFLSQRCAGYSDPGGHNACDETLVENELLEAYEEADDPACLQCSDCRGHASFEAHMSGRREEG